MVFNWLLAARETISQAGIVLDRLELLLFTDGPITQKGTLFTSSMQTSPNVPLDVMIFFRILLGRLGWVSVALSCMVLVFLSSQSKVLIYGDLGPFSGGDKDKTEHIYRVCVSLIFSRTRGPW